MAELSQESALYAGVVGHKRLTPFRHAFRYRVYSLYVDLDALPTLHRRLRLFSYNRPNLFSFHDRDHGPRDGSGLRPWIDAQLARAGVDLTGGRVMLLCFPRVLGYVFNPLSVWFCFHADGGLRAILYEVRNTFGESHCYLMPLGTEAADDRCQSHRAAKRFYVSPFLDMDAHYRFRAAIPADRLDMSIVLAGPAGPLMVAHQQGARRPLADRTLLRLFVARPLMTLKVITAIHLQALRLWRKGARVRPRGSPPRAAVTVVDGAQPGAIAAE